MTYRLLTLLPAISLAAAFAPPAHADADFGQVGLYVSRMLEDMHYSHHPLDNDISSKFLDNYLNNLDPRHDLFTQADVNAFRAEYKDTLDDCILLRDLSPATKIYDLYKTRVKERVSYADHLLDTAKFNFDSDRNVALKRKKLPWPKDKKAAESLWHDLAEAALLQEITNDETKEREKEKKAAIKSKSPDKKAAVAAKPEHVDTPVERVKKDYDRLLQYVEGNDAKEVANTYLSCLATTYDPHSEYMSPQEMDSFNSKMGHFLFGIGAQLQVKDDVPQIQGIMIGGPADKQGELGLNDKILAVAQGDYNWVETKYMRIQKVTDMIRGKEGTTVNIRVLPADDPSSTREITIVRGKVELKDNAANAELLESPASLGKQARLGWIHLASFYGDPKVGKVSTSADVEKLLRRLIKEDITGLVLDLRGNGGGSLDEAIKLTGLFINSGPVVQIKDSDGRIDVRNSRNKKAVYDGPMIVLTDKASASASEILAAALQDYRRAIIIGDHSTYGKGTVQTVRPVKMPFFADKGGVGELKVTIQKFYRIAGGSTQLKGVVPDLYLPSLRDAMDFGEATHDNALPYDQIPAANFDFARNTPFPIAELKSRVTDRTRSNPDFAYLADEVARLRERLERDEVSLSKKTREQERTESEQRKDKYLADRTARAKAIGEAGKNDFKTFLLTLDNVNNPDLVPMSAAERAKMSGMKVAEKSADEDSDDPDEHKYPYGIEPSKLESFHVLQDLIELQHSTSVTSK